ncbi:hypothetical protein [Paragemmobacter ruber]|uniref:Uncharacterized protein n=1 Tax=Paragemmobacter ruber TaxID=1985673 RepID=A0ABW9Y5I0_9RHOB|nr:hypothetical protein [Rhodobacter ruber]NBE07764.1 hypothetical protein [Rhodobacter ruber]
MQQSLPLIAPPLEGEFDLAPPVPGPWQSPEPDRIALFLQRLAEAAFPDILPASVSAIRFLPLTFFPGWLLCDVHVRQSDPPEGKRARTHSLLYGPDGFTALDGNAHALHMHNALHGITLLDTEAQSAYLRFFCYFVHGEMGPFEILTDSTLLHLPDDTAFKIAPLTTDPEHDGDHLMCFRATVLYADTLFSCRFGLHASGVVEMLDDTELASDVQRRPRIRFLGTGRFRLEEEAVT